MPRHHRVGPKHLANRLGFYAIPALLCASFLHLSLQAGDYVWDHQNTNGIWNDPVNWGLLTVSNVVDKEYNVEPTAADVAIFRTTSPAGTVTLTNDAFAQLIRQNWDGPARTITIDASQTADRTLTLSGTGDWLFACNPGTDSLTLDGTPNGHGARLKLKIDGSGTVNGTPVNTGVTLAINCDVSGAGGFILNVGDQGAGRLVLGGTNTYTGPTTANAGTLVVNGSTAAASAVSVNSGATLGGTGTIAGPVTVSAGGRISPGVPQTASVSGIGALTLSSNLTFAGNLLIEVDKSLPSRNDKIIVGSTLTNAGNGTLTVRNLGAALSPGDTFQIFNQPVLNGQALTVVSYGENVVWMNELAVDGSITVQSVTPPPPGNPTTVFTWTGADSEDQYLTTAANWENGMFPLPGSGGILVFKGDIYVPHNWPHFNTNYGPLILIFNSDIQLNGIKILGGSNNTVNLGSYVRQMSGSQPCYFGIDSPIDVAYRKKSHWVTNYNLTVALGDASCGSQTDFQCNGGRLDVYGVLKDGAGTSSRLVKSGSQTLNITGVNDNIYTGGTIINEGGVKLQKPPGVNAIPGDVTVNGSAGLTINVIGGEQIADTAIVTLNSSGSFDMIGEPETVRTIQSTSPNTRIYYADSTLTVAPLAGETYNGGLGVSDYAGSISGSGTLRMNGTGTYGLLKANTSLSKLTVNSGTLKVNGKSSTGAVTVNTSGTLLGQGTIKGAVTVASGGTIGAGFSVGKLTLPNGLNMSAGGNGATNVWELAALKDNATGVAGTDFDQIVLTGGTLTLGTQATLEIQFTGSATAPDSSNPFWQAPHTWTIISLSGGSNPGPSNFGRVKNGNYSAGNFTTTAAGSSIVLTFTPNAAPVLVMYDNPFSFTNGSYGFAVQGQPGQAVVIEASVNLADWLPIHTNLLGDSGECLFYDLHTGQFPRRYYRARLYAGELPPPVMLAGEAGIVGAQFRMAVGAAGGQELVAEASTNLVDWSPILTNTAGIGPCYFYDPDLTNFTQRSYRVFYVRP